MPDVREKLVELLRSVPRAEEVSIGRGSGKSFVRLAIIADHLIANGVTIQRWIPVTERLPDDNIPSKKYLCYWRGHTAICKYWRMRRIFEFNGRVVNVTHWMELPAGPEVGD